MCGRGVYLLVVRWQAGSNVTSGDCGPFGAGAAADVGCANGTRDDELRDEPAAPAQYAQVLHEHAVQWTACFSEHQASQDS